MVKFLYLLLSEPPHDDPHAQPEARIGRGKASANREHNQRPVHGFFSCASRNRSTHKYKLTKGITTKNNKLETPSHVMAGSLSVDSSPLWLWDSGDSGSAQPINSSPAATRASQPRKQRRNAECQGRTQRLLLVR